MSSLRVEILKVPEVVVGALCLRDLDVRFGFPGMDEVWKLDCILDEEDWYIVSNDVPVSLVGVKLDSKSTNVSDGVCRPTTAEYCAESQEQRSLAGCVGENACRGVLGKALVHLECSKRTSTPGVDDSFRDPFVVEA